MVEGVVAEVAPAERDVVEMAVGDAVGLWVGSGVSDTGIVGGCEGVIVGTPGGVGSVSAKAVDAGIRRATAERKRDEPLASVHRAHLS